MKATSLLASFLSLNFGTRSLKSENSEVAYSNVLKEILNDDHRNTQTDEKMKADTTTKTAEYTVISKWF